MRFGFLFTFFTIVNYICAVMSIITLTTDWRNDDFYVGAIKGLIYSQCPNANIVDITHKIENYKSAHAAFILRGTFPHFPVGTIHLICTNSEVAEKHIPLCITYKGQYFIGCDMSAMKVMFLEQPEKVVVLSPQKFANSTFPELTILAQAACMLANGASPDDIGIDTTDEYSILKLSPSCTSDSISGNVIYIDSYKNIITDISRDQFDSVCNGRRYEIVVKNETYKITQISKTYSEVRTGELLALFNSLGLLEIAMRNAFLATLANIECNNPVLVKFL